MPGLMGGGRARESWWEEELDGRVRKGSERPERWRTSTASSPCIPLWPHSSHLSPLPCTFKLFSNLFKNLRSLQKLDGQILKRVAAGLVGGEAAATLLEQYSAGPSGAGALLTLSYSHPLNHSQRLIHPCIRSICAPSLLSAEDSIPPHPLPLTLNHSLTHSPTHAPPPLNPLPS